MAATSLHTTSLVPAARPQILQQLLNCPEKGLAESTVCRLSWCRDTHTLSVEGICGIPSLRTFWKGPRPSLSCPVDWDRGWGGGWQHHGASSLPSSLGSDRVLGLQSLQGSPRAIQLLCLHFQMSQHVPVAAKGCWEEPYLHRGFGC